MTLLRSYRKTRILRFTPITDYQAAGIITLAVEISDETAARRSDTQRYYTMIYTIVTNIEIIRSFVGWASIYASMLTQVYAAGNGTTRYTNDVLCGSFASRREVDITRIIILLQSITNRYFYFVFYYQLLLFVVDDATATVYQVIGFSIPLIHIMQYL